MPRGAEGIGQMMHPAADKTGSLFFFSPRIQTVEPYPKLRSLGPLKLQGNSSKNSKEFSKKMAF
jgi:hypothetical protein